MVAGCSRSHRAAYRAGESDVAGRPKKEPRCSPATRLQSGRLPRGPARFSQRRSRVYTPWLENSQVLICKARVCSSFPMQKPWLQEQGREGRRGRGAPSVLNPEVGIGFPNSSLGMESSQPLNGSRSLPEGPPDHYIQNLIWHFRAAMTCMHPPPYYLLLSCAAISSTCASILGSTSVLRQRSWVLRQRSRVLRQRSHRQNHLCFGRSRRAKSFSLEDAYSIDGKQL